MKAAADAPASPPCLPNKLQSTQEDPASSNSKRALERVRFGSGILLHWRLCVKHMSWSFSTTLSSMIKAFSSSKFLLPRPAGGKTQSRGKNTIARKKMQKVQNGAIWWIVTPWSSSWSSFPMVIISWSSTIFSWSSCPNDHGHHSVDDDHGHHLQNARGR